MTTTTIDALISELSAIKAAAAAAPAPMPAPDAPHRTFMALDAFIMALKSSGMNSTMPMAQQINSIATMLASGRPADMGPQPLI